MRGGRYCRSSIVRWHPRVVTVWDELSPEERCVLTDAIEEAALNGVIGDFLGHAESGGAIWIGSTDEGAITALIPRFAAVVGDMIHRDLIEIREPADGIWNHAPAMTVEEIQQTLADPDTWVWTGGVAKRMVWLMTTDHADRLIGRDPF
jgi:hypothetical protein